MAHDPRSVTSLLDLEPVKRQQHGCRVGYQVRAPIHTRVRSIHLLILLREILKTKGFF